MRHARPIACLMLGIAVPWVALAQAGSGKKRRPLPHEFGRVLMNSQSEKAGQAPVVFEHWLHRARFSCRLCHVDLGFAMKPGGTDVKAADNAAGYYCGACHNGRMAAEGRKVFASCPRSPAAAPAADLGTCVRCHSVGKSPRRDHDFAAFAKGMPRGRFGNGIDWERAEEMGLVKPADFLEGISIKRKSLAAQKDFALTPKQQGMPDIIFSHVKHTVWNGCELCHPEIFAGVSRGSTSYSMTEIFEGKYCGVCHLNVAFPVQDCQRCHAKPVR